MHHKLLDESAGRRTFAIVLSDGEEAMQQLTQAASDLSLDAGRVTAIGGFSRVTLGYFDIKSRQYLEIPVEEQVELLSLVGDITQGEGQPKVHVHAVVGKMDGSTVGGHLLRGAVRPTMEVIVTESPAHLRRKYDEATGLALIDLQAEPAGFRV